MKIFGCWWRSSAAFVAVGIASRSTNRTGSPDFAAQPAAGAANSGFSLPTTTTWSDERPRASLSTASICAATSAGVLPVTSVAFSPLGSATSPTRMTCASPASFEPVGASASSALCVASGRSPPSVSRTGAPIGSAKRAAAATPPCQSSESTSATAFGRVAASVAGYTARATAGGVGDRVRAADARRVLRREGREAEVGRRLLLGALHADLRRGLRPAVVAAAPARGEAEHEQAEQQGGEAGPGHRAAGYRPAIADLPPVLEQHAPLVRYDGAERDRATSVEALTARVEGDRIALRPRRDPLPDVTYGRRVKGTDGRTGCSTGSSTPRTTRTAGSSAPAATRATGRSSSSGSGPAGGPTRRPSRSTPGPSAARGRARSSWPTTPMPPTRARASTAARGRTPTTSPTAAAARSGPREAVRRLGPLAGDVGADGRLVDPRRVLEPARPGVPGRRPVARSGGLPRPGAGLRERGPAAAPRGADRRVAGGDRHRRVHLYGNSDTRPARRMIRFNLGMVSAACRIHGHRPWNGGTMLLGLIARSSV